MNLPEHRIRVIRAGGIRCWVGEVIALIAFRGNDDDTFGDGITNRAALSSPDSALLRVVTAVKEPGIREVTVVGNIDVVSGCPHERAHDGFREKEALCIAGFDTCNLHIWCDAE